MTVKDLIEELSKYPPEMRVVTPRVEDYGDSGIMEEVSLGTEEAFRGEDPEEGEIPQTILIIDRVADKEDL